jgi:hypothetical protein
MAKFSITPNPTFKAEVPIPQVGGDPVSVSFTFRYRDRAELAVLFDSWKQQAEALGERFKDAEPTLADITAAEIEQGVGQVKDLVVGWGFDDPFTDESVFALVKSCIGVSDAVVKTYSDAFSRARLGN